MTDQPKPRGPLCKIDREYWEVTAQNDPLYLTNASILLEFDSALRNALAEVEIARERLGPAGYKILDEVRTLRSQLAESDARIIANSERYAADREIWREMLLAAEAENLRLRGEFERIVTTASKTSHHCYYSSVARDALASTPTELAAALGELVETCAQLIKARINMRDLSGPVHRVSLAHDRVDAALGRKV